MSFSTKERTELRAELDSVGYNWDYVDSVLQRLRYIDIELRRILKVKLLAM